MNFKGVIFDLDGTLIDSIEDIADAVNIVLQSHGFPLHDLPVYKHFVGNGIRKLVVRALPEDHRDDVLVQSCFEEVMEAYRENCVNKSRPYDGIPELLDAFTTRNMKMAVLSNKADEFTKRVVATLLAPWNFESVIGLTDEAIKKPNPTVALQLSEQFGMRPDEIIYIGDSGVDMQTATNAGMYAVGVLWGFRDREELMANGAKVIIGHPMELFEKLG